jgi:hypothetical protein
MRFEGDQLRAILAYQTEPVMVRDGFGRPEVEYENARAALPVLRRGTYYGVGHAKRIHFIQPYSVEDRVIPWGAEVDFGAPCGAGFQYVGVRTGRPKQRVNGAKRSKVVKPSLLTKSSIAIPIRLVREMVTPLYSRETAASYLPRVANKDEFAMLVSRR